MTNFPHLTKTKYFFIQEMGGVRKWTTVYCISFVMDMNSEDIHITTSSLPTQLHNSCPLHTYIYTVYTVQHLNCFHDLLAGAKHKPCMTLFQHLIDPSHESQAVGRLIKAAWASHHVSQSREVSCNVVFTYNLHNTNRIMKE